MRIRVSQAFIESRGVLGADCRDGVFIDAKHLEKPVLLVIVGCGVAIWILHSRRAKT